MLGKRSKAPMTALRWSAQEPQPLNDPEVAEELGAQREDSPGFVELLGYDERGRYLPDND